MTKYETERVDALRRLGCSACAVLGVPNLNELELHHLLEGGFRMGHWFTIFLCRGHHQGKWSLEQIVWIDPRDLIAISDGRKLFNKIYGTERELWERAQDRLRLPKVWPPTKIVPRRGNEVVQGVVDGSSDSMGAEEVQPRLGSEASEADGEAP